MFLEHSDMFDTFRTSVRAEPNMMVRVASRSHGNGQFSTTRTVENLYLETKT